MNKNDLRFQKTELLIKNAYFKLKKRGSTIVKVKDLCDLAMINKSTFYAHYETIEFLHKAVCMEFVTKILSQIPNFESIQNQTREIVYSILGAFVEKFDTVEKLYGGDLHALVHDIEIVLMAQFAESSLSEDDVLAIRFCIGGAFRLLAAEKDAVRIQKTIELIGKVLN